MKLHELQPAAGSTHVTKRIGRGHGSGWGKPAGKGHKGQWARSGGGVRRGFEGGQQPLASRIPKRGFNNIFRTEYSVVNVSDLERVFESGAEITEDAIVASGLIKKTLAGIKLLAKGDVTKKFTVKVSKLSGAAKEKIEKAGGTAEALIPDVPRVSILARKAAKNKK